MTALIQAENITIEFPVYENADRSLKSVLLKRSVGGFIHNPAKQAQRVVGLSGVSFTLKPGDRVALLGHNGSGKTTLLRALAGVYSPSVGRLQVNGRVTSLLDISMGLDPDASGYENIFIRGVLSGLSKKEVASQVEQIAEFSELGDYLSLPVRIYSSGMMLRLAFAISTSNVSDVVLMDEWLSVGDENFMNKAERRLQEMISSAAILVIATHDKSLADRICNCRLYLEGGKIVGEDRN